MDVKYDRIFEQDYIDHVFYCVVDFFWPFVAHVIKSIKQNNECQALDTNCQNLTWFFVTWHTGWRTKQLLFTKQNITSIMNKKNLNKMLNMKGEAKN